VARVARAVGGSWPLVGWRGAGGGGGGDDGSVQEAHKRKYTREADIAGLMHKLLR
jgi:hypothetical protein